jgi:hypothetical protein
MKQIQKSNHQVRELQKSESEAPGSGVVAQEKSREQLDQRMNLLTRKLTGTQSDHAANRLMIQAANALVWPKPGDDGDHIMKGASAIAEMAPQNATEAMLAVQMIATHEAALMFVRRATGEGQTVAGADANVLRATRLMRVFNEQLEAMQKLKGKAGQQKVTVEHVHVYEGGQAIVGAVSGPKGDGSGGGAQ